MTKDKKVFFVKWDAQIIIWMLTDGRTTGLPDFALYKIPKRGKITK
jgi:hypothetical protein